MARITALSRMGPGVRGPGVREGRLLTGSRIHVRRHVRRLLIMPGHTEQPGTCEGLGFKVLSAGCDDTPLGAAIRGAGFRV